MASEKQVTSYGCMTALKKFCQKARPRDTMKVICRPDGSFDVYLDRHSERDEQREYRPRKTAAKRYGDGWD